MLLQPVCGVYGVSIHAPARGATVALLFQIISTLFQSTRPRGARLDRPDGELHTAGVSIHAPARGATDSGRQLTDEIRFQSTRPRGARPATFQNYNVLKKFQSTRPRGARRDCANHAADLASFNPRAREGRDQARFQHRRANDVSIHAPARGATSRAKVKQNRSCVSIHAPARGATERQLPKPAPDTVSIHAPARGATFGGF